MDMRALPSDGRRTVHGVVAGFHAPGRPPAVSEPSVLWTSEEDALFRSDIEAFVIKDCRLLGDLTLAPTVGRPTLFVVDDPLDLAHLSILQSNREIILTPYDAVHAPAAPPAVEGLREHVAGDVRKWIASRGLGGGVPATLEAFRGLTKANFEDFARRAAAVMMPRVQHFWRLVGQHGALAQTLMATPRMIRVGVGGPFDAMTPTLLFVDPAYVDGLAALSLGQSTVVVAPFALPLGEPVDALFAEFVDARREPFHLHDVITFGDVNGACVGCLFGEYTL